ncbi:unnamed protein product [Medioppia subpectinata]|uniref:Peptidase S1 domain-containing protein n=1 Tax=Medioppia subpectinata TaxID=1979941 RepID=A0A7R9KL42_9ACAR|nr:unnamed protein product [Medioppia subpectinata]CAG2105641.1 unnamed protein product [Medioppia subpectinata]
MCISLGQTIGIQLFNQSQSLSTNESSPDISNQTKTIAIINVNKTVENVEKSEVVVNPVKLHTSLKINPAISNIPHEGSNPWVAVILKNNSHHCTGSILNNQWIISAANCFTCVFNSINITSTLIQQYITTQFPKAPGMAGAVMNLDKNATIYGIRIGSISVSLPLLMSHNLPKTMYEEPVRSYLITAGWGHKPVCKLTENRELVTEFKLDIIQPGVCAEPILVWPKLPGNSGGPAIEFRHDHPVLIGTVSYAVNCSDQHPLVFTKISYFLDWIHTVMEEHKNPFINRPKLSQTIEKNLVVATFGSKYEHGLELNMTSITEHEVTPDLHIFKATQKNATLGAHPWVVVVLQNNRHHCTGSILNDKWVMTAAHCFKWLN